MRTRMLVAAGVVVAGGAAVGTSRWVRRSRTWGATAEEVEAALPGDELSPSPERVHTRAITVDAPPEAVWAWLTQLGQDRSGFFSYTGLENLVGCRMPEVHELRPEWSTRSVGDPVWMAAPDRFGGQARNEVAEVIPGRALVLVAPGDRDRLAAGAPAVWVWQLCVLPGEILGTSRLVVRSRYATASPVLEQVHACMERRMLRTIAHLAERDRDLVSPAPAAGPVPAHR